MVGRSLDFYQIIYREEQRASCYPFAKVYFNETLTDSFENDVICRLVPESNADYIGVASWRLAQKRGDAGTPKVLNHDITLTPEKILAQDFDIAILTPRRAGFRYLYMAANWHGKAWDDAFSVFSDGFLRPAGISVPKNYKELDGEDLTYAIHENHFIAEQEIYQTYVRTVLRPAIEFMNNEPIFNLPSGYLAKKRDPEEINAIRTILQKWGMVDYPIKPFILERLFSIFINQKTYKVINL